jgi:predicted metalloprotease
VRTILGIVLALGTALGGCKTEIQTQLYVSDIEAATKDTTPSSLETTLTAFGPGLAKNCDKAWAELNAIVGKYFPAPKLQGCKGLGMEDAIIIGTTINLLPDSIEKPASCGDAVCMAVRQQDGFQDWKGKRHKEWSVRFIADPKALQSLDADLKKTRMTASLDFSKVSARINLRNDKRQDVPVIAKGVFWGGKAVPGQDKVLLEKRRDAEVGLSDVHVAHLLRSGSTEPLSILIEEVEKHGGVGPGSAPAKLVETAPEPTNDELKKFVAHVLADTEDVWHRVFNGFGKKYTEPKLTIFDRSIKTGCGSGQTSMGPFYCPADQQIYIDLAYFDEMKRRHNAPGDFAQAVVVARLVGHHVQGLLGISERAEQIKASLDQRRANQVQVRIELQADCLAGVWATLNDQANKRLRPTDIDTALHALSQLGDDMVQRKTLGRIVPDEFSHGTSAQRTRWFKQGVNTGRIDQCDTFNAKDL